MNKVLLSIVMLVASGCVSVEHNSRAGYLEFMVARSFAESTVIELYKLLEPNSERSRMAITLGKKFAEISNLPELLSADD